MTIKITSTGYDNQRGMMVDRYSDGVVVAKGAGRPDLAGQTRSVGAALRRAEPVYQALLAAETDGANAVDMRRVLGREREALHVAMQSGDVNRIEAATAEGARVAKMWGSEA